MHTTMKRVQKGALGYYICDKIPVRHAFTTKTGGVSAGACESLNLGFSRGDDPEAVRENYRILCDTLGLGLSRLTRTEQVHRDEVSVVTEELAGTGLTKPMVWESDAIVTNLSGTPLAGFYADCVVTLLFDPASRSIGVCHSGWRGTAAGILPKTVDVMAGRLGARRESLVAVMGPSIRQCCFETGADVPEAMESSLGAGVRPYIEPRGEKWFVDLQGINAMLLRQAGLAEGNIVDSGICTYCEHGEFWSHRYTHGVRGVHAGVICL